MSDVPYDFQDRHVCVMGLGYVGLTLAVVMAEVGFEVTGVEIRKDVTERLKAGEPHFFEPGLKERLQRVVESGSLTIVTNIPVQCNVSTYVVTVGTPLGAGKQVRKDMISNVAKEIGTHLKDGDMVVMRSTVELGTTRKLIKPILDSVGKEYDLVFCPERTLEGRAIRELRELPQIVGGQHLNARIRAARLFQFLTPTVVQVSSLETAELIKLIDNSQRDVQFALANEVARISDAIGVSAMEVIQAGKLGYPRTNLPVPGPVGGPCLEKDSYILANGLNESKVRPEIIMAARQVNENQPEEVVEGLKKYSLMVEGFSKKPVITLAGLAFKGRPETDDLRGSMAFPILKALRKNFPSAEFRAFDPVVAPVVVEKEFELPTVLSIKEAFEGSSLLVIANNHSCFENISLSSLAAHMADPGIVFDFWNNFSLADAVLPEKRTYIGLGELGRAMKSIEGGND
ncbi:MAG: nucleotide sugar dehydrogenase [Pseudomonadota bacterium]|nr:nucleotide sugar dehydrogenase [Pseudomonadota bacterium]